MTKLIKVLSFILFLNFSISFSQSETQKIELTDLIKELIKTKKDVEIMKQIWWLPEIYWEVSLKDSNYNSQGIIDEINSTLKGYTIILAIDVNISAFSGIKKNKIENINLVINNVEYNPLKDIPDDVNTLIGALKPTFSKMLGQLGESIEFFIFDNTHENKISPIENGSFTVFENNSSFEYSLPLSALVKKKTCPIDNKLLSGNWIYCPWHGGKLINK